MADTKFTPGPWESGTLSDYTGECFVFNGGQVVAIVPRVSSNGKGTTAHNAHLISAAPELYEALYRLVTDCEIAGLQEQAGFDCWISMANAALTKARGETA